MLGCLICTASLCFGAAAQNVQLEYDSELKILKINANHPTDHMDRNFIRRVIVSVNAKEIKNQYFTRQSSPSKFSTSIECEAKPQDTVEVQLYSSEGGVAKEVLVIPKEQKVEE